MEKGRPPTTDSSVPLFLAASSPLCPSTAAADDHEAASGGRRTDVCEMDLFPAEKISRPAELDFLPNITSIKKEDATAEVRD